jgi:hypothetical protein
MAERNPAPSLLANKRCLLALGLPELPADFFRPDRENQVGQTLLLSDL